MSNSGYSLGLRSKYIQGLTGVLDKKGHIFKTWRSRYFVLDYNHRTLKYYGDTQLEDLKGGYRISKQSSVEVVQNLVDGRQFVIAVKAQKLSIDENKIGAYELLLISAPSEKDRDIWVEALSDAINGGYRRINISKLWYRPFSPFVPIQVTYGETIVSDTSVLLLHHVKARPQIKIFWPMSEENMPYFSLFLVDIDYPIQVEGQADIRGQFLHWAVVNIKNLDISSGEELRDYLGPIPPYRSGLHRYYFLLFPQQRAIEGSLKENLRVLLADRLSFSLQDWISRLQSSSSNSNSSNHSSNAGMYDSFPSSSSSSSSSSSLSSTATPTPSSSGWNTADPCSIAGFFSQYEDSGLVEDMQILHRLPSVPPKYLSPSQQRLYQQQRWQQFIESRKRELCINSSLRDVVDTFALLAPNQAPSIPVALGFILSPTSSKAVVSDIDASLYRWVDPYNIMVNETPSSPSSSSHNKSNPSSPRSGESFTSMQTSEVTKATESSKTSSVAVSGLSLEDQSYHHRQEADLTPELSVQLVQSCPVVRIGLGSHSRGQGNDTMLNSVSVPLCTMVLCDPDMPSRTSPHDREYFHWVVVNIPQGHVEQGDTILPYLPPTPKGGTGVHRYFLGIYQQSKKFTPLQINQELEHIKGRKGLRCGAWLRSMGQSDVPAGIAVFLVNNIDNINFNNDVDNRLKEVTVSPSSPSDIKEKSTTSTTSTTTTSSNSSSEIPATVAANLVQLTNANDSIIGAVFEKKLNTDLVFKNRFVGFDAATQSIYWSKDTNRCSLDKDSMKSVPIDCIRQVELKPNSNKDCSLLLSFEIPLQSSVKGLELIMKGPCSKEICQQFQNYLLSPSKVDS